MDTVFVGIDPGELKGGVGIVDQAGRYLLAERWNRKNPRQTFKILQTYREQIKAVYLEDVNLPQKGALGNQHSSGSNLLINSGIWQGWLIALNIPYVLVHPLTWQALSGLTRWQAKLKKNPNALTPLIRAREFWPAAPLQFLADDGKAVGLLLADMARRDNLQGIDRQAIRDTNHEKAQLKRKNLRQAKKAQNSLASDMG